MRATPPLNYISLSATASSARRQARYVVRPLRCARGNSRIGSWSYEIRTVVHFDERVPTRAGPAMAIRCNFARHRLRRAPHERVLPLVRVRGPVLSGAGMRCRRWKARGLFLFPCRGV